MKCFISLIVLMSISLSPVLSLTQDENSNSIRPSERACRQYSNTAAAKVRRRRVIGGEATLAGEFPWMAALGYLDNFKVVFSCGGVIISDSYILTAANCIRIRRPVIVLLGNANIGEDNDEKSQDSYQIETIIQHPEYKTTTKKSDIALIQLTKPIKFSNRVKPVCLRTDTNDIDENIDLITTGWGTTSLERPTRQTTLLKANLKTVPLAQCNATFLDYNKVPYLPAFRNGISENQYCAHDPNGIKDSCQGDSGGPLQMAGNDTTPARIVGIVSFGVSCGGPLPGVYTRVASYLDWIEQIVWPNN